MKVVILHNISCKTGGWKKQRLFHEKLHVLIRLVKIPRDCHWRKNVPVMFLSERFFGKFVPCEEISNSDEEKIFFRISNESLRLFANHNKSEAESFVVWEFRVRVFPQP